MKNTSMRNTLALGAVVLSFMAAPAFAERPEGGKDHKRGAHMFEKQDTNGDGVISKAEFLVSAEERFSKMDADGNGEVTKEEAKAAKEAMRSKMKERKAKRDVEAAE